MLSVSLYPFCFFGSLFHFKLGLDAHRLISSLQLQFWHGQEPLDEDVELLLILALLCADTEDLLCVDILTISNFKNLPTLGYDAVAYVWKH